jgi:hypothetical protein
MSAHSDYFDKYTLTQLAREVRRVFGPADVRYEANNDCSVVVDGWPSRQYYHADRLGDVLKTFPDGYGEDEAGDAEVCRKLELEGAHIPDHGYAATDAEDRP